MKKAANSLKKTALVTGGAIRLGKEISLYLASLGFDVALHYNSSKEKAQNTKESIEKEGVQCECFPQDFSEDFDATQYLDKIRQNMPHPLTLLVNSASYYEPCTIAETKPHTLEHLWQVNFKAPYFLMQAFFHLHNMEQPNKENVSEKPQIINILDNKIAYQQYHYAPYILSKKALHDLSQFAAIEFAPYLRVNCISPGIVMPNSARDNDYLNWRISNVPLQECGTEQHILLALKYLIDNSFVTSQVLTVDGGESKNHVGYNTENYKT